METLLDYIIRTSIEDPGGDESRIVRTDRFVLDTGYVELDDVSENSVVNGQVVVSGNADTGDTEDILSVAMALAQRLDLRLGCCYVPEDGMDEDELLNVLEGTHLDGLFHLDCTVYGAPCVAVDPYRVSVRPISEFPEAMALLEGISRRIPRLSGPIM